MTDKEQGRPVGPDVNIDLAQKRVFSSSDARPREQTTLSGHELARVLDVKIEVSVELGRRRLSIAEVLALGPGVVLEFYKNADEPLDICINGRLVARGEAVVMGDRYGVRITEVVSPQARQSSDAGQDANP